MTSETGSEVQFEYDQSAVGVDVELGSVDVTAEMIADYCEALGETSPLYTDAEAAAEGPHGGIIAPPGLLSALSFGRGGLDPKVRFGNTQFHAGSRLEIFEPIRPGDAITATTRVKEVYPKTGRSGTMVFVVRRTTYTNQHGQRVVATEQSTVHREV